MDEVTDSMDAPTEAVDDVVDESAIESIQVDIAPETTENVPGDDDGENNEVSHIVEMDEGVEEEESSSSSEEAESNIVIEEEVPSSESMLDPTSEKYIKYPDSSLIDITQISDEEFEEAEIQEELDENGFFVFPKYHNPGLVKAYSYVCPPPVYHNDGIELYKYICESLKVFPIKRFIDSLKKSEVDLRYYGIDSRSVRAIAEALSKNTTVTRLDLEDNWLSSDAVFYLGKMLQENLKLKYINLTGCRIGVEGAAVLKDGISGVRTLQELNLSWNNLGDEGMEVLAEAITINFTIKKLNLSHNKLGNETSFILARIMEDNETLEELNLSFNDMYPIQGLKVFLTSIITNMSLTQLNLAWNALSGLDTGRAIKTLLAKSELITHVDLSNNRFVGRSLRAIKAGMKKSVSLTSMDLSYNPIKPKEANSLLTVFCHPLSQLTYLGLQDVWVDKDFLQTLEKAKLVRAGMELDFEVLYAGVYSNYKIQPPDTILLLFKRGIYEGLKPKKKKKKKQFGHVVLQIAQNERSEVPFAVFTELIKATKIKLEPELVQALADKFPVGKRKVDLKALKDYYMQCFPDTVLPVKPPKKAKKKKGRKKVKKAT